MNTSIHISYDISRNSHAASSYTIDMAQTEDPVTDRLVKQGDTYNNIASYRGVFVTQSQAVAAALGYIEGSVRLVEINRGGDISVLLQPATAQLPKVDEFTTRRVLGSRTERGTFIAA